MSEPLYRNKALRGSDFRLIWWLLSHQEVRDGVASGELPSGWRTLAKKDLALIRQDLWASEQRLKQAGVIVSKPYERKVRLVPEAFA